APPVVAPPAVVAPLASPGAAAASAPAAPGSALDAAPAPFVLPASVTAALAVLPAATVLGPVDGAVTMMRSCTASAIASGAYLRASVVLFMPPWPPFALCRGKCVIRHGWVITLLGGAGRAVPMADGVEVSDDVSDE